jgi:hypothetical protein
MVSIKDIGANGLLIPPGVNAKGVSDQNLVWRGNEARKLPSTSNVPVGSRLAD